MHEKLWQTCQKELNISNQPTPELMTFGNTKEMADELAELVLAGEKIATSSLLELYDYREAKISEVGDYALLLNGDSDAVAVVKVVRTTIQRFGDIDEQFAKEEGDGSLANWLAIHLPYYTQQLARIDQPFSNDVLLHCIWFEVVKLLSNET
ncbi:ASCH domain-containing protein [Isobaculum melis]|uniref:Uncharacterized protein YhfF n=1 Tax=Isobaculum melis TaxID=142588 RepID=A0A1H9TFU7_9LACT|nr:ASCH domain-containing protein [Isobaculum melis]SER96105.1 Uncharacterized protein YhfF [Isobaculum melis]